ncbi:MAG TPA: fibronectin type III domain-containing protein [Thermomicrobiaceae bacterium]|nr:fibronectin type III domain-containing protein [Thermomicrobiaceae bacterium]
MQWAHAVAPKAGILLVEANNSTEDNLFGAIDYAAGQGASVISNSWGGDEFAGEEALDSHCVLSHAICVFSSGDSGNPGGYPAYNPAVLAVGGTTLHLAQNGSVTSETAWAGSGGGVSAIEPRPAYQTAVNLQPHRGMPDVSYDADPFTGFPVYDSVGYLFQKGWFGVGGTSAGAPQWSAIVAVADQLRVANGQGRLNSTAFASGAVFYGLAAGLGDITAGSNGNCGEICQAAKGYDLVTGLGSPRAGIDQALAGTLLAAPTGVAASATGANSAQVSWNYSGSTQTAFEVFLSGSDTPAATVGAGSRAAAISGLQPGTRYCFQVVAYDGAVASARSQAACAVTLGSRPVPAGGGINLSPASVTFTNRVETLSVHVAGAGAAPVDGATVYYTTSGGPTCSPANGSGTTDQAGNVSFSCTISSGRFSRLVFSAYAEQNGQAGLQTGPGGDLLIGTQSVFVVF